MTTMVQTFTGGFAYNKCGVFAFRGFAQGGESRVNVDLVMLSSFIWGQLETIHWPCCCPRAWTTIHFTLPYRAMVV